MSASLAAVASPQTSWELIRHVNGRPWTRRQIGWYTLTAPTDFTRYGEYGADYCEVTIPAGRYPIYACRDCGTNWHSLLIPMDGVIKSGSWWNGYQPGEPWSYTLNIYTYAVAAGVLGGTMPGVELLAGVEAREMRFEFDGVERTTHGIFIDYGADRV